MVLIRLNFRDSMAFSNQVAQYFAHNRSFPLQRTFWRIWYNAFAYSFRDAGLGFMNYGYASLDPSSGLPARSQSLQPVEALGGAESPAVSLLLKDERNKDERDKDERNESANDESLSLALYRQVASAVDLAGKDVLEVGCGRGGGGAYVAKNFAPKTLVGVDFSRLNVKICNRQYARPGLSYDVGDAENLTFGDRSFDAVINVESSHCYAHENRFFSEVFRVLRPCGYFLFTDFRPVSKLDEMEAHLAQAGLRVVERQDITQNVVRSLDLDDERKLAIVKSRQVWFYQKYFAGLSKCFAGNKGTPIYESFKEESVKYIRYVLQKV